MNIHYDFNNLKEIRNAVVTTGSFDGVHNGHKVILERLKKIAFDIGGESVLITFYPHPRQVLYPDTYGKDLKLISSQREKIELLRKAGIDHLIIANFTKEFSNMSSVSFVKDILLKQLHARKIITGYNHRFGHNREGDTEVLMQLGEEFGFDVEEIPEQDIQHEKVSSVTIRKALTEGDIQKANKYLDHNYIISGKCRGVPQKNLLQHVDRYSIQPEEEHKLIPPDGTYSVSIIDDEAKYSGKCFITNNKEHPLLSFIEFEADEPLTCQSEITTLLFHEKLTT